MYTDGSSPEEQDWDPDTVWMEDERYLRAADLFDHRYYWEAHEAWEALWHCTTRGSGEHAILQSMIQAAASMLKHHMGSRKGAHTLLNRAESHLEFVIEQCGPCVRGLDIPEFIHRLQRCLSGGEWPLLPMVSE